MDSVIDLRYTAINRQNDHNNLREANVMLPAQGTQGDSIFTLLNNMTMHSNGH